MDNLLTFSARKQLLALFPVHKAELESLFEEKDECFTELVHDFFLCKGELKRLVDSANKVNAAEYEETLNELEEELLRHVKNAKRRNGIYGSL